MHAVDSIFRSGRVTQDGADFHLDDGRRAEHGDHLQHLAALDGVADGQAHALQVAQRDRELSAGRPAQARGPGLDVAEDLADRQVTRL